MERLIAEELEDLKSEWFAEGLEEVGDMEELVWGEIGHFGIGMCIDTLPDKHMMET